MIGEYIGGAVLILLVILILAVLASCLRADERTAIRAGMKEETE